MAVRKPIRPRSRVIREQRQRKALARIVTAAANGLLTPKELQEAASCLLPSLHAERLIHLLAAGRYVDASLLQSAEIQRRLAGSVALSVDAAPLRRLAASQGGRR